MSIAELTATIAEAQSKLIKALQEEYFCDDVQPPPEAFGWEESRLRAFMESGGETPASPDVTDSPPPPSLSIAPLPAVDVSGGDGYTGRPTILCLGDAATEFGSHIINLPTADLGSAKHKASLSVTVEPVASEFLRSTETDNPGVEHGPGWISLLARDYAWRTTADVLNRGYSGYNSTMLRADLPAILGPLRRGDVVCVILMLGANDAAAASEPTHVPPTA